MPWKLATPQPSTPAFVSQEGTVPNGELPYHYRGADLFVSTDVIAACPNSVIEALACGVPVLGFEAGVLPEMLDADSGLCVPYGADPWQWHPPKNTAGLVAAARQILADPLRFRRGARRLAEERYDLDQMVDRYLAVLEGRS
jgi:glycosyltransferase involved in cell wall biosynthesis